MEVKKLVRKDTTLDELLTKMHFSKKDIYQLKQERRIIVDGNTLTKDDSILEGSMVIINISKEEESDVAPVDSSLKILYEDDIALVVEKPVGLIIHDDGNNQITLDNLVSGYYQKTNQKHKVYHIHRLDKDTSGCVLYCKESLLVSYFDDALANKKVNRAYLALVGGILEKAVTVKKKIGKDRHINGKYRVSDTGKEAITHVKPLKALKNSTLVSCQLETGRTHQIRVHLSYLGHPIVGDELYGGRKDKRMLLHAYQLSFIHPITHQEIIVKSDTNIFS